MKGDRDTLEKVVTYIPQDSVIGRLLKHREKIVIVKSNNKGLYQHDIYSWEILCTKMVLSDRVTDSSEFTNMAINEWLLNTTAENRKIFVDSIFDLLYSSDSESFRELSRTWVKEIPNMMFAYNDISKEDKKIISSMLKEFVRASSHVFKEKSSKKIEKMKDNLFDKK